MLYSNEHLQTKPIRRIEYTLAMNPPVAFAQQAHAIFWEEFFDWQIYTSFTKRLAQSYIAEYAAIPENPFRNPMDTYLDFKSFDIIVRPLGRQLAWVLSAVDGNIEGKRILDLGCGSTGDTKDAEEFGHLFEPWLCRALMELGAQPIGVDTGKLTDEKFEVHQQDLLIPNSLDFLDDNSIEVVHSRALVTSLQMNEPTQGYLMGILDPQVVRILKPNGAFVYSKGL